MLTLLLLRHAKAVAQGAEGDDFSRILTGKGHQDARRLGTFLAQQRPVRDAALVSAAARTRQTFEDLQATAKRSIPYQLDEALYNATERQLRGRLERIDARVETYMIVGHNPGIMDLAQALASSGDLRDFDTMRSRFPPCTLVVITFDRESWEDVQDGGGQLDRFLTPDLLDDRS